MSAAPAPAAPADGEAPKKGNKKMIIIIAAVAVLLLGGGGAAFFIMKKKAAEAEAAAAAEEGGDEHEKPAKAAKQHKPAEHGKSDHATPPAFVPLDPFVVNLSDKEAERFAQIGVTLQVDDPKVADELKVYMPAIRNAVLLILSHKSSADLLTVEGKQKLAEEIRREAARAMGYEVEDPEDEEDEDAAPKKKKKKKKRVELYNPIVQVHYSNFIIQ
jgi:flagellar FliL protein